MNVSQAIARRSDARLRRRGTSRWLAVLVLVGVAALASGCGGSGESGEPKIVLTSADVRKAFEHQGLDLAAYEVAGRIPALGYPVDAVEGDADYRVVCLIFDFPVMARGYVETIRAKKPGNVSRAVRAKNVVVLTLPAATTDDVQRTLRTVVELRHE
jgi:hypothetical protein